MNQAMQAKFCGPFVHSSKRRGLHLQLVSADAEGDDGLGFTGLGGFHHGHRSSGAELPNRVKHPPKTKTAALEWLGRMKQSRKICLRLLLSQKQDRKSTRLNSSHRCISYAVFCLKKKKQMNEQNSTK